MDRYPQEPFLTKPLAGFRNERTFQIFHHQKTALAQSCYEKKFGDPFLNSLLQKDSIEDLYPDVISG